MPSDIDAVSELCRERVGHGTPDVVRDLDGEPGLEAPPTLPEQHAGAGTRLEPTGSCFVHQSRWAGSVDEVQDRESVVEELRIDWRSVTVRADRGRVDDE